jgi:hypothetical protein
MRVPMVVRATLVKLKTDDGLVQFEAHATLGAEYFVDLTTIMREQRMIHTGDNGQPTVHHKDIIFTVDGTWLPLDCLALQA